MKKQTNNARSGADKVLTGNQNNSLRNAGFTLIEIIVVIMVVAILVSILMPALNNTRTAAREAQVVADIKNIEAAIAAFKLKYGIDPPSSFLISPNPADYNDTANKLGMNSKSIMRQLWPNYEFGNEAARTPGQLLGLSSAKYLNGAECLVFFLGGARSFDSAYSGGKGNAGRARPDGFSANPINPFADGGSRVGPFLELDAARLVDTDDDGFFELLDTLPNQTQPYQYLSSYDGRGYQPFGYDGSANNADDEVLPDTLKSAYLKNDTKWGDSPAAAPSGGTAGNCWNGKSYQIISPGMDAQYGVGGSYSSQDGIATKSDEADSYRSRIARSPETDNITNFSTGTMRKLYTPAP